MVERICPRCDAGNPGEQAFCGHCGLALDAPVAQPLARRPTAALASRSIRLPARWRQTGQVVALGIASLAAEAGLAWLQRRQQAQSERPAQPTLASSTSETARVVAVGRRIRTTWRNGQMEERIDEQVMWLMRDDPGR